MNMTISELSSHIAYFDIPWSYCDSPPGSPRRTKELAAKERCPYILEKLLNMTEEAQRFMLEIYSKDSWFGECEIATEGYHQLYIEEYGGRYEYVDGQSIYDNWLARPTGY